jgi:hypothetical protein
VSDLAAGRRTRDAHRYLGAPDRGSIGFFYIGGVEVPFMKTSVGVSRPRPVPNPITSAPEPGTVRTANVDGKSVREVWTGTDWIPEAEWIASQAPD